MNKLLQHIILVKKYIAQDFNTLVNCFSEKYKNPYNEVGLILIIIGVTGRIHTGAGQWILTSEQSQQLYTRNVWKSLSYQRKLFLIYFRKILNNQEIQNGYRS